MAKSFTLPGTGIPLKKRDLDFAIIASAYPKDNIIEAANFILDRNRKHWKSANEKDPHDNRIMYAVLPFKNTDDIRTGNAVRDILHAAEQELGKSASVQALVDESNGGFTTESATLREARDWANALKERFEVVREGHVA